MADASLAGGSSAATAIPELHFIGEVDYGIGFDADGSEGIFLEFICVCGNQWWDITKNVQQTQTAYPDEESTVVWNHPLDLHFATGSISDWPKLYFQVYKLDSFGRVDPLSVGVMNLPTTAGSHSIRCRTFSPLSQSELYCFPSLDVACLFWIAHLQYHHQYN